MKYLLNSFMLVVLLGFAGFAYADPETAVAAVTPTVNKDWKRSHR